MLLWAMSLCTIKTGCTKGDTEIILVGITNLQEGPEVLAPTLAKALGQTLHEGLTRLRGAGSGPIVIGVHQNRAQADAMTEALTGAGFTVVTVDDEDFAREAACLVVRRFAFTSEGLRAEAAGGESLMIAPQDIRFILKGTGIISHEVTEKTQEKKFSAGLAIATQGLVTSTTVNKTKVTTVQEREGFAHVYTAAGRVVEFRETRVDYSSLGDLRKPTRLLNFAWTVSELRRMAPESPYDERLLTRNLQAQLLGPILSPEKHIMNACALLAKTHITTP